MTLRRLLTLRNEHLLEVMAGYHSRRRWVPMSPRELEMARAQRRLRAIAAGTTAHLAQETLPYYATERLAAIYNRRPYPCYLCPDPACPANLPGHQLYCRAQYWGKPQEPPRCQRCGRQQVLVGAGETYRPEPITPHKETTL